MTDDTYGALGQLTGAQLQAACDRFGLGRLRSSAPLTMGLFGRNVALDTDSGRWVLRGMPWPADSDEQFRKERFWARQITERSRVEAPWPYHVEPSSELFGWPYAVMRMVDGEALDWSGPFDDAVAIAAAVGSAAADLRSIVFDAMGEWRADTDDVASFAGTADEWLRSRAAAWLFRCGASQVAVDADGEDLLMEAVGRAAAHLDRVTPGYVHHDLKLGNVTVVRDAAAGIRVGGVFDLAEGYVGDPVEDLARSLWGFARTDPAAAEAFLTAGLAGADPSTGTRERLRAYVILDLLVFWEYGRRERLDWFGRHETFSSYAGAVLRRVEPVVELAAG